MVLREYIRSILLEQRFCGTFAEEVFAILTKSKVYYSDEMKAFRESSVWTDDFEKAKKQALLRSPKNPYVLVVDEKNNQQFAIDLSSGNKIEL